MQRAPAPGGVVIGVSETRVGSRSAGEVGVLRRSRTALHLVHESNSPPGEQGSSTAHAWSGAVPCFGATSGVLSLSPWMRGRGAAVDSPSLDFWGRSPARLWGCKFLLLYIFFIIFRLMTHVFLASCLVCPFEITPPLSLWTILP